MTTTTTHEAVVVPDSRRVILPASEVAQVKRADDGIGVKAERRTFTITVSLGTDHHRFDRLVEWIGTWVDGQADGTRLNLQAGYTSLDDVPHAEGFVPNGQLRDWFSQSDVVVVQGGPGGIMDARSVGRLPIVVPRRAHLGEHVDDHQVIFTRAMAKAGRVIACETEAKLQSLLTEAKVGRLDLRIPEGSVDLSRVSAKVAGSVHGGRLPTRTVLSRLGFSLMRSGDHHFDPDGVEVQIV